MATDLIRYDLLVQNAFRDVFRKVMTDIAAKGLPGEHHFLVTFRTGAPGVKISDRLRQAHPQDMTIVLQHQFWDLAVTESGFSVGLSFKNVPEKLIVPFSAVTGFFDPSVNFGAEFTVEPVAGAADAPAAGNSVRPLALATTKRTRGSASEPAEVPANGKADATGEPAPKEAGAPAKEAAKAGRLAETPSDGPKVVSIDAFRKKP